MPSPADFFFAKQNFLLEETHGFTPENTRFAEGGCCDEINEPELEPLDVVAATRFLMARIDEDLRSILTDLANGFDGQIALITGVTINTEAGNFFSQSRFEVL